MTTAINLSELPPPSLQVEATFESHLERLTAAYLELDPSLTDVANLESEPMMKFIQLVAMERTLSDNAHNAAGRAVLLATATGSDLDHLGALIPVSRQPGESDDIFRQRIRIAPEAASVAGPVGAYVSNVFNRSPDIKDVHVQSPSPGVVDIYPLWDASFDSEALIAANSDLSAYITSDDRVPLTDMVRIVEPSAIGFDVEAVLTILPGPDYQIVLDAATSAVQAYISSRRKLGRLVSRTGLSAALTVSGVETLQLISPVADIVPSAIQYAELGELLISEAGA